MRRRARSVSRGTAAAPVACIPVIRDKPRNSEVPKGVQVDFRPDPRHVNRGRERRPFRRACVKPQYRQVVGVSARHSQVTFFEEYFQSTWVLTYVPRNGPVRSKNGNPNEPGRTGVKRRKGRQRFAMRMFDAQANPCQYTCLGKLNGNRAIKFRFNLRRSIGDGRTRQANRICCWYRRFRR